MSLKRFSSKIESCWEKKRETGTKEWRQQNQREFFLTPLFHLLFVERSYSERASHARRISSRKAIFEKFNDVYIRIQTKNTMPYLQ